MARGLDLLLPSRKLLWGIARGPIQNYLEGSRSGPSLNPGRVLALVFCGDEKLPGFIKR